jgi:hypothetical protein
MRSSRLACSFPKGTRCVILEVLSPLGSALSHVLTLRRLQRGEPLVLTHWPLSVTVAMLFAVSCLIALWAVLVR